LVRQSLPASKAAQSSGLTSNLPIFYSDALHHFCLVPAFQAPCK
jgi:hypothetical protein